MPLLTGKKTRVMARDEPGQGQTAQAIPPIRAVAGFEYTLCGYHRRFRRRYASRPVVPAEWHTGGTFRKVDLAWA
jgi:hypothetical protein